MGENSAIQWTDHTMNFWIGCTAVSPACDHCYAQTLSERYGWAKWGAGMPRYRTSDWSKPAAWNRKAAKLGLRYRVFSNSLSDFFDVEVPDTWRNDAMVVIEATPNLDWLLLTKRPKVARWYFERRGGVPTNVWLGTTIENEKMTEARIPDLLAVPAPRRFLSMEPLLEPVSLRWLGGLNYNQRLAAGRSVGEYDALRMIDWVIVGGESGVGWRPIDLSAVRAIRDQCVEAGVSFFFKQHAGRNPKALGRDLDGCEWNEIPQ
jgi:protein gp37